MSASLNVLSLFSGIGGLELGLERAGMTVVGQVEIDDYCRRVLAKHWPDVPRHDDVKTAAEWWLSKVCENCDGSGRNDDDTGDCLDCNGAGNDRPFVDVVCGGFPCQPFSRAGLGLGVADERWGWPWMASVIRMVRPRYVVVENVAALLDDADAFGRVLTDLAACGFDADWSVLSACAVGAPHARQRLFVVAYPHGEHGSAGLGVGPIQFIAGVARRSRSSERVDAASRAWRDRVDRSLAASRSDDRKFDGLAGRMVAAGGNAVVPQVAEHVGRLIVAHDEAARAAA